MSFAHVLTQPLSQRITQAKQYMQAYGGQDQALWPYQEFSMTVDKLLEAATTGHGIKQAHLKAAYRHAVVFNRQTQTLWAYQDFAMNVGELLEAAIQRFEPEFITSTQQEVRQFQNRYEAFQLKMQGKSDTSVLGNKLS